MPLFRGANTVTLKRQRSTQEGDQEVERRSGTDESIWAVIHLFMEAMLGSLCMVILISTSKNVFSFLLLLYVSSSTKLEKRAKQVLPGSEGDWGEREGVEGRGEK
jgi:hypothetical protein